jgi:LPS O-antigen subunit length determinant protein (WzzB/FepE family)
MEATTMSSNLADTMVATTMSSNRHLHKAKATKSLIIVLAVSTSLYALLNAILLRQHYQQEAQIHRPSWHGSTTLGVPLHAVNHDEQQKRTKRNLVKQQQQQHDDVGAAEESSSEADEWANDLGGSVIFSSFPSVHENTGSIQTFNTATSVYETLSSRGH